MTTTGHDITTRAMLARLSISQWTARKHDAKATAEVKTAHKAQGEIGRFNKQLVDRASLEKIAKIANEARTWHYAHTLPWSDDGARILPAAMFDKYREAMETYRNAFEKAADEFAAAFPDYVSLARNTLNGLFNDADYPADVRGAFALGVRFAPLPAGSDFRVSLSGQERDAIRRTAHASPLFSPGPYARHIEAAYERMWQIHLAGETPRSFAVEE